MGAVGGVAKALSMIKGTFLNPMWVKMAGGGLPMGMGGGGGAAGPAGQRKAWGREGGGRVARAQAAGGKGFFAKLGKIFGKRAAFLAPLLKIFAPLTKIFGKAVLSLLH